MIDGDSAQVQDFSSALAGTPSWIATNRDQSKMTIVVMTGVTTLARATAYMMEQKGIELPGHDIQAFLADADFVHVSNETAFATDCPPPKFEYTATNLRFCSDDRYLALFKSIRANLIELTGNHVNDWGHTALNHTLDLYDQNKMAYFGGGRNTEDARKGITLQHNGNIIAFIGCNPVGPEFAWATETDPGAAKCDDDYLSTAIPQLKQNASLLIMDIQYQEYYQYDTPADQVDFFNKYVNMGADIVLGTQAHQPMGFAFSGSAFVHYGLGNLFFDQMDDIATRQMFMDKLIIYKGKHLSTVLFTGIIEDYSRPRPMTTEERSAFLKQMFGFSGW
jgi:poly-gamma-glutamate synthesis protein (capsule biosynthesis protein)